MIKRLFIFLVMPLLALSGKLYGQETAYTFPDGYLDQAEDIQEKIKNPYLCQK